MKRFSFLFLLATFMVANYASDASAQRRGRENRRGNSEGLKVGELAPTFVLKSLDGQSETDLSSFRGDKPVILFFGSYT